MERFEALVRSSTLSAALWSSVRALWSVLRLYEAFLRPYYALLRSLRLSGALWRILRLYYALLRSLGGFEGQLRFPTLSHTLLRTPTRSYALLSSHRLCGLYGILWRLSAVFEDLWSVLRLYYALLRFLWLCEGSWSVLRLPQSVIERHRDSKSEESVIELQITPEISIKRQRALQSLNGPQSVGERKRA